MSYFQNASVYPVAKMLQIYFGLLTPSLSSQQSRPSNYSSIPERGLFITAIFDSLCGPTQISGNLARIFITLFATTLVSGVALHFS